MESDRARGPTRWDGSGLCAPERWLSPGRVVRSPGRRTARGRVVLVTGEPPVQVPPDFSHLTVILEEGGSHLIADASGDGAGDDVYLLAPGAHTSLLRGSVAVSSVSTAGYGREERSPSRATVLCSISSDPPHR